MTGLESIEDKRYNEFSCIVMSAQGPTVSIRSLGDNEKEATIYAYVAASLLRLFTKSPTNYIKVWTHIIDGFQKFYGVELDMQLHVPSEGAIKGLAAWMSMDQRAKTTLYRIPWLNNSNQDHQGLKRFLYDMHLANTGMHLANMFNQICKIKNCKPSAVLTIINTAEYTKQIECLVKLIHIVMCDSEHHKRKMWKYGRLFDETFIADIQTKSCPKLVWMFATALKLEAPKSYPNVHNIAQLADVSETNQRRCDAMAQEFLKQIKKAQSIGKLSNGKS